MEVKIITKKTPEELQMEINKFLNSNSNVISIDYEIGSYPNSAEFSALILFEN